LGYQTTLFKIPASEHVVNVASVPQRSPFRYPGGKTWLVPRVRQWLTSLETRPTVLVEPFAGGGIVGLTAAFEELAEHIILVELDKQVAAVWQTLLGGGADWLTERILSFDLTHDTVLATLARDDGGVRERAFRTILKNRTFHGGIMAPGASLIKHGENGKGLKSRWYAETLARRIMAIDGIRDRFTFVCGDGIEVMREYARQRGLRRVMIAVPLLTPHLSSLSHPERLSIPHQQHRPVSGCKDHPRWPPEAGRQK